MKSKTIERSLYIEVKDNSEGLDILNELVKMLTDFRNRKAYLNGWIGPVRKESK
jgi:hypothetical protein